MEVLDRVLTAARHEEPDKVPFVPLVYGMVLKRFAGLKEREYYGDFKAQLEAKIAFQRRFPDLMGPPASSFCLPEAPQCKLATAFGGRVSWMEDAPPWVSDYPVKEVEDVDRLVSAGVPDPREAASDLLRGLEFFWEWFPEDLREKYGYINGNVTGGTGLVEGVALMMGYDKFLVWLFLHPEEVHKLLNLATEYYLRLCDAVIEITGPAEYFFLADHSPSFVGTDHFNEFILPYFNRVFGRYKGALRIWHCEGSCSHMLEEVDKIDAEVWQFGAFDDPAPCKEKTHFCLMGNLHPPGVLLKGTPSEVEEAVREIIVKAGPGGGR
ncbi:MAG: uroporphyrinogen decarboxylase family protein, partial [Candidatus Bathyarchaeia archaeon]